MESSLLTSRRLWNLALLALVAYRLVYHAFYLTHDPFALGTFSDGRLYEQAARDLAAHPPLGTQPFYLQGLYAALLSTGFLLGGGLGLSLLVQIALCGLGLWLFFRAATDAFGPTEGRLSTVVLLGYPMLTFYENKYLSAELGVLANIFTLWAFVRLCQRPGWRGPLLCGLGTAATILARPNLLAAVPFTAVAIFWARATPDPAGARTRRGAAALLPFALGLLVGVLPMAIRNGVVTGHPTIFPVHGGGTSFFIGNNPRAQGLWNNAGVLSGEVESESDEFARFLGLTPTPADPHGQASRVGAELYRRAFEHIRQDPLAWLHLVLRKLWLSTGNDEISQDYSLRGEQEMIPFAHRVGWPFGVVLSLGLLGALVVARRGGDRPLVLCAAGQLLAVLASCLLFFTSAQHRLPLCVPLSLFAGPALSALREALGSIRAGRAGGPLRWAIIGAAIVCALSVIPRGAATSHKVPSSHYYNLAMVRERLGDLPGALSELDRAVGRNPKVALFHLQRGRLLLLLGQPVPAVAALEVVSAYPGAPPWIYDQARQLLLRARAGASPQMR